MTTLTKSSALTSWPILVASAAGCFFFGFAVYTFLRIAVSEDNDSEGMITALLLVVALAFGFLLELRCLVQLSRGSTVSFRNFVRVIEIHLHILIGVLLLIVLPAHSLLDFPEGYEHVSKLSTRHNAEGLSPDMTKTIFVGVQFAFFCIMIHWGLSLLNRVSTLVKKISAPSASDDPGTTSSVQSASS